MARISPSDPVPAEPVRPEAASPEAQQPAVSRPPIRVITLALIALLAAFLVLLIAMNQRTPYTSEAVLEAPVIGIAANVSGDIIEVGVRDNQRVKAGDRLVFGPLVPHEILDISGAPTSWTRPQEDVQARREGRAQA